MYKTGIFICWFK